MLVDVCIHHSYRALLRSVVGEHVGSGPSQYTMRSGLSSGFASPDRVSWHPL